VAQRPRVEDGYVKRIKVMVVVVVLTCMPEGGVALDFWQVLDQP
jgi:hypothetical protein